MFALTLVSCTHSVSISFLVAAILLKRNSIYSCEENASKYSEQGAGLEISLCFISRREPTSIVSSIVCPFITVYLRLDTIQRLYQGRVALRLEQLQAAHGNFERGC